MLIIRTALSRGFHLKLNLFPPEPALRPRGTSEGAPAPP